MTTQYTPTLKLALPVTGELSGTWGDVVNDNITSMIEQAIAGLATINTWTGNAHTLTTANGTTSESRCAMLVAATGGGAPSAAAEIICPAAAKLYVLQNNTSYAVTLKTSAGTGVAVAAGDTAFLFCDGTNVNSCVTTIVNGHITGNLTVDGNATINGNTTLGNATSDTVTVTARVASNVLPSADNTYDLGASANAWKDLYIDGTATMALVAISGGTINGVSIGATTPATFLAVDNLSLDGNTIASTDTNGNIVIAPNGTGDVQLDADTVRVGDSGAAVSVTSNGAGALTVTTGGAADLTLSTNSGTDSGTVVIANGANGNITLTPNGTGDVILSADRVQIGDSNTDTTLTTNGTGSLNLTTNNGTNSGTIQIAQGANGNITLTPNGTGSVSVSKLYSSGNTTLGATSANTLSVAATITSNLIFTDNTYDIGASGATRPRNLYLAGDATIGGSIAATTLDLTNLEVTNIKAKDGTASITIADSTGAVSFANNVTLGDASTDTVTVNGYMGVGGAPNGAYGVAVRGTAQSGTTQYAFYSNYTGSTTGTNQLVSFLSGLVVPDSAYTVNLVAGLYSANATKGAAATINNQHGVYIADLTQGTNNYGITSLVSSGTNKWNIYASGTASNHLRGNTTIGLIPYDTPTSDVNLTVIGDVDQTAEVWIGTRDTSVVGGQFLGGLGFYNSDNTGIGGAYLSGIKAFAADSSGTSYLKFYSGLTNYTDDVPQFTLNVAEAVFNDPGNDYDFRVESDTKTHMLFVDASANTVGINNNTPLQPLDVTGNIGLQNVSGATYVSNIDYPIMFSSEATGSIGFNGHLVLQPRGSAAGKVILAAGQGAAAMKGRVQVGPTETVVNEDSDDYDFRVESDTNAYALFVQGSDGAVSMGNSSPQGHLHLYDDTKRVQLDMLVTSAVTNTSGLFTNVAHNAFTQGVYLDGSGYGHGFLSLGYIGDDGRMLEIGTMSGSTTATATFIPHHIFYPSGRVVFNEGGYDADFRVESDTNTHALFVDAGNSAVSINTPANGTNGALTVYEATAGRIFLTDSTLGTAYGGQVRGYGVGGSGGYLGIGSVDANVYNKAIVVGSQATTVEIFTNTSPQINGTTVQRASFNYAEAVFNSNTLDYDFRVGSDLNSYMLWVDGSANGVNIGSADTIQGQLNVSYTSGSAIADTTALYITTAQTYGTAAAKKNLDLVFQGYRDGAGTGNGAKARLRAIEQTGNSRLGTLQITTLDGSGYLQNNIELVSSEVCINQDSIDMDFRVESDANTHMLFVDAGNNRVGMGTATPATTLEVAGNTTLSGDGVLNFNTTGSAGSAMFRNQSAQVSVSTSATAITGAFGAGAYGSFMIVFGDNGGNTFIDTIIASNAGTPTVLSSTTVGGSPTARTYSTASNTVRLAMASGTYNVSAMIFRVV